MPRVIGMDPGTVSEDLRLAFLAAPGESGGGAGLARALARSDLPVVFTRGVIHLASVPEHRKVNRVDIGTADKVAAAALAIDEQAWRRGGTPADVSLVLLELGGAFSAAVAVASGRIVDGTAGPLGFRAAGALDGEVAFLAGAVPKALLFRGGAVAVAGWDADAVLAERIAHPATPRERVALDALVEGAAKAATTLAFSVRDLNEFALSGRLARVPAVQDAIARLLERLGPVRVLDGVASTAKEGAQGSAMLADGLMGGSHRVLVETLGIRDAQGSVLDHLYIVSAAVARRRLGLS